MDPVLLMKVIQSITDLDHVPQSVPLHFFILQIHQQRESRAFDELHHQKHFVFQSPAELIGLHNVWVIQRQSHFAFRRLMQSLKTGFKFRRLFFVQNLQRNRATSLQIGGPPDFGHASLTNSPD